MLKIDPHPGFKPNQHTNMLLRKFLEKKKPKRSQDLNLDFKDEKLPMCYCGTLIQPSRLFDAVLTEIREKIVAEIEKKIFQT